MLKSTYKNGLIIAALVALLTACSGQQSQPSETTPEVVITPTLTDSDWKTLTIFGQDASAAESTLQFEGADQVYGSTGCNNFRGSVEHSGTSLQFGLLATTRKMCAAAVSGQETVYLEALGETRGWRRLGNTVEFTDADNVVIVQLVPDED
jgi:heat shock protein HslJ